MFLVSSQSTEYLFGSCTYFDDSAEFGVADRQLLMSLLGNDFLQHLLQTLADFSLNEGGGGWSKTSNGCMSIFMEYGTNQFLLIHTVIFIGLYVSHNHDR